MGTATTPGAPIPPETSRSDDFFHGRLLLFSTARRQSRFSSGTDDPFHGRLLPFSTARRRPRFSSGTDDPFHDPLQLGIGVLFLLLALLNLAMTGLAIWGVQYRVPPWNANSFPPPVVQVW